VIKLIYEVSDVKIRQKRDAAAGWGQEDIHNFANRRNAVMVRVLGDFWVGFVGILGCLRREGKHHAKAQRGYVVRFKDANSICSLMGLSPNTLSWFEAHHDSVKKRGDSPGLSPLFNLF
jgi:hypothetical protein